MWIIVDKRLPDECKRTLSGFGELIEIESHGLVYDAISGHPDIFLCQGNKELIVAPNTPTAIIKTFDEKGIHYSFGKEKVGHVYPETAGYNAVVTEKYLIHNMKVADESILEEYQLLTKIHCNQAYTRCNLIALDEESFITSDRGIENALKKHQLNVLYINPEEILLRGFENGFFGGCCGIHDKKLFVSGSLEHLAARDLLTGFARNAGVSIIELYHGPLIDEGGILFLNS
jgi:hypothetical protein